MSERNGIAIAGTILVDQINEISAYPNAGELTQIRRVSKAVGGCVPNVSIDLKRIDPELSIKAVGKIGKDDSGDFLKNVLSENGVDTEHLVYSSDATSFTQVMSIIGGQRTFFTYAGACADFGADDVDVDALKAKRLISPKYGRVKVLARGIMYKKLTVKASKFSLQAVKMITLAGGKAELEQ